MKDRIRQVREKAESKKMSQEEFGKKIGLTRDNVANIELGRVEPSEIVIRAIIREFGVNEVWLRTGVGEMKRPMTWQQEVTSYVNDLVKGNRTEFEETLIRFLAATTPEDWERLSVIFRKIQNEKKTEAE